MKIETHDYKTVISQLKVDCYARRLSWPENESVYMEEVMSIESYDRYQKALGELIATAGEEERDDEIMNLEHSMDLDYEPVFSLVEKNGYRYSFYEWEPEEEDKEATDWVLVPSE